jgi:branched-subunit amino acid transport protein
MPNELPLSLKKSLKYIPVVILTPIIINSLSIYEGTELYLLENNKLYAGLIAILVSTIFKNVLATISIGMLSYVLMSNIF